jgi:transposase
LTDEPRPGRPRLITDEHVERVTVCAHDTDVDLREFTRLELLTVPASLLFSLRLIGG